MEQVDLVNFIVIFFISNHLTQMVNVPTRIPDCDSQSPALSNFFFSPDLSTFSAVILPLKGSPDHVLIKSFHLNGFKSRGNSHLLSFTFHVFLFRVHVISCFVVHPQPCLV